MSKKFKVGDRVRGIGFSDGKPINGKIGTVREITDYGYGVEFDEYISGHRLASYNPAGLCKDGHGWYVIYDEVEAVSKEVIVIDRNDREVIAHNKATGEKATAKCHPNDKFDFLVGAKIAFDRLTNTIKIVKQDKYEIGDKVKIINEWFDGCNENNCGRMNKWLGKTMTIRDIDCDGDYRMEEDKSDNLTDGWCWNSFCIEGKVVDTTEPKSEPKPEPKKLYNGKVVCTDNGLWVYDLIVGKIYTFVDGNCPNEIGGWIVSSPVEDFKDLSSRFKSVKFIEVVE